MSAAPSAESKLIVSMPDFQDDVTAHFVWSKLAEVINGTDGIYYYKHPIIGAQSGQPPDFCLLGKDLQPLAVRCMSVTLDEIEKIEEDSWTLNGARIDSPLAELDDFITALDSKFKKERELRRVYQPVAALALPNVTEAQFKKKFPGVNLDAGDNYALLWKESDYKALLLPLDTKLSAMQWRLAQAIFQSTTPLNRKVLIEGQKSKVIGEAIKLLDRRIAILDEVQHRATVQIPPGPQRIRGLAGTGKTILLTMRAAFIHQRFPKAKILFTFHTQSLYNQARDLITKFYRDNAEVDPDWDNLHVRHGWGGSHKPGVYWDACRRAGIPALTFGQAKVIDESNPLGGACKVALKAKLEPVYDFVLVDEAQDFPKEFFRLLYQITKDPKQIYWAYDELQSLSAVEIPNPEESFGTKDGKAIVSLEGEYPGGIEKDVVLNKSYRCPLDVLMLAHGLGLGVHRAKGPVQMVPDASTWKALGYELESGKIETGSEVVLVRPLENSPNQISTVYDGEEDIIVVSKHDNRDKEMASVASAIAKLIKEQDVQPHQIVVVSLDSRRARDYLTLVQLGLQKKGIDSVIPGLVDDSSEFGETGQVTLSTVYRAKGNEAPIVFIVALDALYDYVEEIENRNRAFTSISRSKGWVKISGVGEAMDRAIAEIDKIRADVPKFKFKFPDLEKIRRLGHAEMARRMREQKKASANLDQLIKAEDELLESLDSEQRKRLLERLKKITK